MAVNLSYRLIYFFLFLVVLFFGVYVRFDDVKIWEENKNWFYYQGEPLYAEYDSFFFARLALDMKEGIFKSGEVDRFRFYPDNRTNAKEGENFAPTYSLSGSLISFLFHILSSLTGKDVASLSFYLIPIFAISVAFPLFFYMKKLNLPWAGLIGSVTAISAPMYLGRTGIMRLDHDVFNLTFPFLISFLFLNFFQSKTSKAKYLWISLASIGLILYQLWYAHPNLNFVLIVTFLVALFWNQFGEFLKKRKLALSLKREDCIYLIILILPQAWYIYHGPYHLFLQVKTLVFNIKSPTAVDLLFKDFPNIFMSISELQKLTFWEAINAVVYSKELGVIGLFGAFILFILNFRNLIFLLPFFGIGLLTFISGARFAMYLAPFVGLGLGYLVHLLFGRIFPALGRIFPALDIFKEKSKQELVSTLIGIIVFISTIRAQREAISMVSAPKIFSPLVKDMVWIKEKTPKDSVIWTWWDYGYAFQLYARRAVFHDGGSQVSPKTYLIARSFATSDPREAWLLTSFVSNYGITGLAQIMRKENATAKEILQRIQRGEFDKSLPNPVYWVFTEDLIDKFGWIHYFGSYDFNKKEGQFGKIMAPICRLISPNVIQCPDLEDAVIDLNIGVIRVKDQIVPIKDIYEVDSKVLNKRSHLPQGYTLAFVRVGNQTGLFIAEPPSDSSLFFQMFILREYDPKYFELVYDNFPTTVIYKVKSK
ncbi:MAG: STT3 domain-containing protein [Caldimicrobium sp.]|nr:dolichyl-diphosphooligosaccharide--protein glycosyltransferase subunit STT3 [Caldimicrobium sp.]MDW8182890.1 STT3 domain-containing protein [Caldimicrobium sp.]